LLNVSEQLTSWKHRWKLAPRRASGRTGQGHGSQQWVPSVERRERWAVPCSMIPICHGKPLAEGTSGRQRGKPPSSQEKSIHLKFLPQFLVSFFSLRRHRDVEILPLLLAQQLKPGGTQQEHQVRTAGRTVGRQGCVSRSEHRSASAAPASRRPFPKVRRPPKPSNSTSLPTSTRGERCWRGPSLSRGSQPGSRGSTPSARSGRHRAAPTPPPKYEPDPKTHRQSPSFP